MKRPVFGAQPWESQETKTSTRLAGARCLFRLADFQPGFEIYLQFDSLERDPLMQLRGADLRGIREKALERLNRLGISTNLVVTVARGVNDGELGRSPWNPAFEVVFRYDGSAGTIESFAEGGVPPQLEMEGAFCR